jgi:hypothetical protein
MHVPGHSGIPRGYNVFEGQEAAEQNTKDNRVLSKWIIN